MAQLVSVSEAARLLGIDKSVVSRQVRGFGIMGDDKRFDLAEYQSRRANSINPLMARRREDEAPAAIEPSAPPRERETFGGSALGKASTAHKALQARLLQLEYDERSGKLVSKAEVDEAIMSAARRLRDKLMALPGRASIEGAHLDQVALKGLLDRLIRQALDEFASDLESGRKDDDLEDEAPAPGQAAA